MSTIPRACIFFFLKDTATPEFSPFPLPAPLPICLPAVLSALPDPTRRAILAQLAVKGDIPVKELAKPFRMSLPAVSKHLSVLENAGLISREIGRAHV